jgi:flagellar protein FlaJ
MRVPFCPIPIKTAQKILGKTFYGIAEPFLKVFPSLELELEQAGYDLNARDYISIALFSSIFMWILMDVVFAAVTIRFIGIGKGLIAGTAMGMFFGIVTFLYVKSYPKLLLKKKVFDIDRNILYALRHMYVQVTSGVPLFDALTSVANGNYGEVSKEFKQAVKIINTGMPIERALENLTARNPSNYFRRAMWQISNGVKSGSDVGGILKNIIDYISAEQKIMIRRYGSTLNPLTVMYMMIAVVLPSLGVTFIMVLSSFSKIPVTEFIFWMIIGFVSLFQFMFLGILKSKRPNLI